MTARTKIKDRILPVYTVGEEIFNMVSHIVGGAVGAATLAVCVIITAFICDDLFKLLVEDGLRAIIKNLF